MIPPPVMAAIKLLAGTEFSYAMGYNQAYMEKEIGKFKKKWMDKQLAVCHRGVFGQGPLVITPGEIKKYYDDMIEEDPPRQEEDRQLCLAFRKAMKVAAASKGVETVVVKNLPGISVDFVARFEDCNPWKVLEYVTSALDKVDGG